MSGEKKFWAEEHQSKIEFAKKYGHSYPFFRPDEFGDISEEQAKIIWEWHCKEMSELNKEHKETNKRTENARDLAVAVFGFLWCVLQPYDGGTIWRIVEATAGAFGFFIVLYLVFMFYRGGDKVREKPLAAVEVLIKSAVIIAVVVGAHALWPRFFAW